MAQRYLVPELPLPGRHAIDGELAHHLGRVLRVRVGESVREVVTATDLGYLFIDAVA